MLTPRSRAIASVILTMMMLGACGGGGGGASSSNAVSGGGGSNSAPVITGKPASTAQADQTYSFQPSASDPDGSALKFTVQNLPAWASFDANTGRISGMPSAAAVGTYSGIVITVTDGSQTAQLGPFTVEVVSSGTGVATLSWTPPTSNTDGSVLGNLAGYRVLYGRSEAELSNSISIDNPSISTYVIERLSAGTWYFAVVAINQQGTWSPLSNVATKMIS